MKTQSASDIITRAMKDSRENLTETESKSLLSSYGIPVVDETLAGSEDEAVSLSIETGLPVVLKGYGSRLTHKTEKGLVRVNLRSVSEIREAYAQIKASAGEDWEGCLIQPLIEGKREFVAGLIRDPQFGPVVMFGFGGIFTEALADTSFRIAPITEAQTDAMIDEIKSSKLLGDFRGEKAVNRDELRRILMGLSRLGLEHPEISEIDINPLIITPDGRIKAVDALIVFGKNISEAQDIKLETEKRIMEIRKILDAAFNAKSIAVVGASYPWKEGYPGMYGCIRNFGYTGKLYPVNPKLSDIDGVKTYKDLSSLPEQVDLVILTIPAAAVPGVLRECIATGNRTVHIFSSGFRETGEEEGIRLHDEIEKIAAEGGLHVIGPNCMGLYVPKIKLLTWTSASRESGSVGLISQSGGNTQEFSNYAKKTYNINFSKVVSYGNALTLDSTDFLDYMSHDDETKIITMYLEGVKEGRRFLELVTETNRHKPVIIFKGGLSESGNFAVSSHTGALAGGEKIWRAFFRQTGTVLVESIEEMADVTLALQNLGEIKGPRTTVIGYGGGSCVLVADNCAKTGLELPAFSPDLVNELRKLIPPAGAMIRNPIDAALSFFYLDLMGKILQLLAKTNEIDNIIISIPFDWLSEMEKGGAHIEKIAKFLADDSRKLAGGKPIVAVWRQYEIKEEIQKWVPVLKNILLSAGIPVYEGVPRAVNALAKAAAYYDFKARNNS